MVAPFSGKLAAGIFHHDRCRARPGNQLLRTGDFNEDGWIRASSPRVTVGRLSPPSHTNWSIRVPCPGGSGAGAGFGAAPASSAALTSGALDALAWGMLTGAGAETAEIFMDKILAVVPDCDGAETNAL
jgi:hypothetical protein